MAREFLWELGKSEETNLEKDTLYLSLFKALRRVWGWKVVVGLALRQSPFSQPLGCKIPSRSE